MPDSCILWTSRMIGGLKLTLGMTHSFGGGKQIRVGIDAGAETGSGPTCVVPFVVVWVQPTGRKALPVGGLRFAGPRYKEDKLIRP